MVPKILKTGLKCLGLSGLIAAETPIHETMHGVTAAVTGSDWEGVLLKQESNWYLQPLETLTGGFYDVTNTLPPGVDGQAQLTYHDTVGGHLSMLLSSAAPEFLFMGSGLGLVKLGLEDYKNSPVMGMLKTITGMSFITSTFYYMKHSFWEGRAGHDYYNVTQQALEMVHLPGDWASVATPLVGIPLFFAATYFTAALTTKLLGKKE